MGPLRLAVAVAAGFCCVSNISAGIFPTNQSEWRVDFRGAAIGYPAHFGSVEQTKGLLITLRTGEILVLDSNGKKRLEMKLDLPVETSAVAANLEGKGRLSIVAVDAAGSVYCFNELGERQWKFARAVKSGEFRLPVFADLDNDGRLEIIVGDSRGRLQVLDANGHLRLEIAATKYRISVPAIGDINGDGKPELIFGTEAGDVYCVSAGGDPLWSTTMDASLGRALPLIADADRDGKYEVYLPTAYNNAYPGLFALDAASGRQLWKAPSFLQSYRSTVMADLNGDGKNEILFGDKNSSVFCVNPDGSQRWSVQLPGRGIFFAPAIAALNGTGGATIFMVVRGSGNTGKSLYALDSNGKTVDSFELPGGGGDSPVLCRFQGRSDVSLVVLSAGGQLLCYRPEQNAARILWPGIRNDGLNSGFIKSSRAGKRKSILTRTETKDTVINKQALGGTNKIPFPGVSPGTELISIKTVLPDKSVHLEFIRPGLEINQATPTFVAAMPGRYDVTIRRQSLEGSAAAEVQHLVYHLDKDFKMDVAKLNTIVGELKAVAQQAPALSQLCGYFQETATASLTVARRTKAVADFDKLHLDCDYFQSLTRYCREHAVSTNLLLRQIRNPWAEFDAAEFFKSESERSSNPGGVRPSSGIATSKTPVASDTTNDLHATATEDSRSPLKIHEDFPSGSITIIMLGNEYESAAVALTNLRPEPVTYRLWCEPFQAAANRVEAAQVLSLHEVLKMRPDGTGEPVEDPLPLLGEGQTVQLVAGETRKLWMTFRSRPLEAGMWHATLKIGDLAVSAAPVEIPIAIEVSPVRLPDRFTYRECNWLYLNAISDETVREATLRDALAHGMNVFVIPGVSIQVDEQGRLGQADCTAHDTLVKRLRGPAFFLVSGPVSLQWPATAPPSAELQEKTFAEGLRWYSEHMRSLGCDYDDYAIYLQDEPGLHGRDAGFEAFVAQVKRFKAAEPRIELYANPAGGARAELLRPLQDLIDVWAPDLHLVREQPAELTQLFQHGKHYWHYEAPADQRYLGPLGFYRMKPWVAFQMGMTGGGYWVYSSANFWVTEPAGGDEYGSIYPTDKGPVTTKRWEASRDGIEDYELITLVRTTSDKAAAPAREQALALIDEAVRFVTHGQEKVTDISRHVHPYTPDYEKWMRYRQRLIDMQLQLTR